jgi:3-oxoacyl-[acyl-carrier-protein] synthase II
VSPALCINAGVAAARACSHGCRPRRLRLRTGLLRCVRAGRHLSSLPAPPDFAPRRRVAVTGIGLVTPLGIGAARTWERLVAGHVATSKLEGKEFEAMPCRVAACVPRGKGAGLFDPDGLPHAPASRTAPFVQMALIAASEALVDASGDKDAHSKSIADIWGKGMDSRCAVCVGSGIGALSDIVSAGMAVDAGQHRKVSPFFVPKVLLNMAAAQIAIRHGVRGPNHAMVTACAAGAHNIIDAAKLIALGEADVALAGGSESCVEPLAVAGFSRAKALATDYNDSPHEASRPFDTKRCGFVMGEGAGVLVLEELESARKRGARIYAEVRGWGSGGDGYHITSPAEDGAGAALVMQQALRTAGLDASDVAHINCHATSTPMGDGIETHAIARVFPDLARLKVTSVKGNLGHLLGAAGAVEAALTILSLHHGTIPATANFTRASDDLHPGNAVVCAVACSYLLHCWRGEFAFGGLSLGGFASDWLRENARVPVLGC